MTRYFLLSLFLSLLGLETLAAPVELGHPIVNGGVDGWRALMNFDQGATYTNLSGNDEQVTVTNFSYYVGNNRGRVTPFVFQVVSFNAFVVLAIGDTRVSNVDYTSAGAWSHPFATSAPKFLIAPGETIGVGFTDAAADGSGSNGSVIPFINGGSSTWLSGGGADSDTGQVTVGAAPQPGSNQGNYNRNYAFRIGMDIRIPDPEPPTGLTLSNTELFTGMPAGMPVGQLTAQDAEKDDTHTFQLVAGTGDTDNTQFMISGNTLTTTIPITGNQVRSIRVKVEDRHGFSIEVVVNLSVTPAFPPSGILLNRGFIARTASIGSRAGILSSVDANAADRHRYTFASGAGDTHNAWFTIANGQLLLAQPVPGSGSQFQIRVRSTDLTGLSVVRPLTIAISDADVRINEFVASNRGGLMDEEGDNPDWIEVYNFGAPIDLGGWHLSDNNDFSRWTFPDLVLSNDMYLVIFASGKDRTNGTLHTNFQLDRSGESLRLVLPDGLTVVDAHPPIPQFDDVSYGYGSSGQGYLTPTPGAANGTPYPEAQSDLAFSHTRGFYTNSFQLVLTPSLSGATIRYTTNNTKPSASNGSIYTQPITITPNTANTTRGSRIVRAIAVHPDAATSPLQTHTYLFVRGVNNPATDGLIGQSVLQGGITNNPTYQALLDDALLAQPAISIVRPAGLPNATEGETSIEFFDPSGREPGFQADCGIKLVGGASVGSPKNNFRLYFRNQYGQASLTYPLFVDHPYSSGATDRFERLNLRSGSHDSFYWLANPNNPGNAGGPIKGDALYLRNRWINDMALSMGQIALHGRFAQLFVNGEYRGQYQIHEWPNDDYLASYLPGNHTDYEYTNGANASKAGSEQWQPAWNAMKAAATTSATEAARWLDFENLADYMLLSFYAGNPWDWNPNQNWMAGGPNKPDFNGWKFFHWDTDICLQDVGANALNKDVPDNVFTRIMTQPDFQVLFSDRIFKHCFYEGVLTSNRVSDIFQHRVNEISTSIVAETARWQSAAANPPWDRDDEWQNEVDRMLNSYFPQRTGILLDQFRARGWYPVEAPDYSIRGGGVPPTETITLSAPSGTIYYTTDNTDPRLPGGQLSPTAKTFPADPLIINAATIIRTRALDGGQWSAIHEVAFTLEGTPPASSTNVLVSEIHYNPPGDDEGEFIEFHNPTDGPVDLSDLVLSGAVNFHFPPGSVIDAQGFLLVVEDLTTFAQTYQQPTSAWYRADLHVAGAWTGKLPNNEGTLVCALGTNELIRLSYRDDGKWPGRADGAGSSIERRGLTIPSGSPAEQTAGYSDGANWRASSEYQGSPGYEGLGPDDRIVINEILAHTDLPSVDSIELFNPGTTDVALTHWVLSDQRGMYPKYRFPTNTLAAGAYLVLDENDFNNPTNLNGLVPFALNANTGEDVYLLEADASGHLLRFVDHAEFGATRNGESIGRWPNGSGDWYPMQINTFGEANHQRANRVRVGPVVIVNIHYNPLAIPDDGLEFVRLYNDGTAVESLANWQLGGEVDFALPAVDLSPGSFLTLVDFSPTNALTNTAFRSAYDISEHVVLHGPWSGRLNNAGGSLRLYRPDTLQVPTNGASAFYPLLLEDQASYHPALPWPVAADGSGAFLERADLRFPGDTGTNWVAATLPLGFGYEIWALDTFPPGTAPALRAADAHYDPDPYSNYAEYLFGSDPLTASGPHLQVQLSDNEIRLLYRQRTDHPGLRYTLEHSPELNPAAWQHDPNVVEWIENQPLDDHLRTSHWRALREAADGQVFRVRVE